MKEHQETMLNLRQVLETEVSELRCRLRIAEEKNLQLIQRSLGQICSPNINYSTPQRMLPGPQAPYPGNKNVLEPDRTDLFLRQGMKENPTASDFPDTFHEERKARNAVCQLNTSTGTPMKNNTNPLQIPKEYICLLFSIVILALSYFVRAMDTGCRYQTLPYSLPPSRD